MKKMSELFSNCAWNVMYETIGDDVDYAFVEEERVLYIYFQGSKAIRENNPLTDWIRNFAFFPVWRRPYKNMKVPYKVHGGFLKAWKEVDDVFINKILEVNVEEYNKLPEEYKINKTPRETCFDHPECFKYQNIIIVGYSHGAALCFLATECLWFWRQDLVKNGLTRSYAFESPRVMHNLRMPEELAERWSTLVTVINNNDIVTRCPPKIFGFCHGGDILHINTTEKLGCLKSHFPGNVYTALLKYENDKKTEKIVE